MWQFRTCVRFIADLHSPEVALNAKEVFRVHDFLVPEKLRPRTVRCVTEVMGQFVFRVPAPCRLRQILTQEGEARVRVTVGDHVAGEDARLVASSRTRFGPSSSGHQSTPSTRAGVFPSSRVRGRWNHLRTPMSLYAPARSPTTSATKWSRTAIASGVARAPEAYLRVLDADTPTRPANSSDPRTSCNARHSEFGAEDWSSAFAPLPTLSVRLHDNQTLPKCRNHAAPIALDEAHSFDDKTTSKYQGRSTVPAFDDQRPVCRNGWTHKLWRPPRQ